MASKKNKNVSAGLSAQMSKAAELRAQLALLETGIKTAQAESDAKNKAQVATLPGLFGLADGDYVGVIATIRRVTGTHGKRVTITPEIKAEIIKLAKEGSMTGAEIAAKVGCSVPTVASIKKQAGLVKARAA